VLQLIQRLNDDINRSSYDSALQSWARHKQECDEHNAKVMSDPTFPYDAFGQDKLWKLEPPPDASKYMNRSISDNAGCFIVIGIIVLLVLLVLGALVRGALR
jgi:hypothetical protein